MKLTVFFLSGPPGHAEYGKIDRAVIHAKTMEGAIRRYAEWFGHAPDPKWDQKFEADYTLITSDEF